ncbi:glutamate--cysteine ligase [Streptomyces sp. G-G2]|uniref:carboxylate-amine ligase n=1 Tax=Streptomyces sp. G-G2 TaxID=3046201 RepID=UPI0024BA4EE7|nr:glutamate--cysteine ligase [Streptomyces sp. G-G2]MDJ0385805.1 glutamate--cysteine ligase [Streptomyces sp. G-G2]
MGVEEEYILVDRRTRTPAGRAPQVLVAARLDLGPQAQAEFFTAQVEVCTKPTASTTDLRAELVRLRSVMAAAADDAGCLLIASGTPPLPSPDPLTVTAGRRYAEMASRHAQLMLRHAQVVCGCHIHIGVTSRAQALELANRMRPWLPALQALAANSPFADGRDTGYASWRSVEHARWPTVGPAPVLDEVAYERLVSGLISDGTLLDRAMVYWYARPSEHVPTLEIRVADVNADLDTVVLLAALVRGLASVLLAEIADGRPPPAAAAGDRLREAHYLAALHGLEGPGLDPDTGTLISPWRRIEDALERAAPGLYGAGDMAFAEAALTRLRAEGAGAAHQRAVRDRCGRLQAVVDDLAFATRQS